MLKNLTLKANNSCPKNKIESENRIIPNNFLKWVESCLTRVNYFFFFIFYFNNFFFV